MFNKHSLKIRWGKMPTRQDAIPAPRTMLTGDTHQLHVASHRAESSSSLLACIKGRAGCIASYDQQQQHHREDAWQSGSSTTTSRPAQAAAPPPARLPSLHLHHQHTTAPAAPPPPTRLPQQHHHHQHRPAAASKAVDQACTKPAALTHQACSPWNAAVATSAAVATIAATRVRDSSR
jgi:hypothetical protein